MESQYVSLLLSEEQSLTFFHQSFHLVTFWFVTMIHRRSPAPGTGVIGKNLVRIREEGLST